MTIMSLYAHYFWVRVFFYRNNCTATPKNGLRDSNSALIYTDLFEMINDLYIYTYIYVITTFTLQLFES